MAARTRCCGTIDDSRWSCAKIEPFRCCFSTDGTAGAPDAAESQAEARTVPAVQDSGLRCTICNSLVGMDRNDLITHYQCDWHRHNLRRVLQGRPLLTEDEFEQKISDDDEVSSLDSDSDDDDDDGGDLPLAEGSHAYFVSDNEVFSIYRCILRHNETISSDLFKRPLDCTILLLAGGHFSGGIYKNDVLITHKCFHRYVIRAKQGSLQSASDARGSKSKSSGASLRRHNERALCNEIQRLLASWSDHFEETPLIFLRCSTVQRQIFFEKSKNFHLEKSDDRIRAIPFETRRPTLEELKQTWLRLKAVRSYGPVDLFNEELLARKMIRKKRRRLFRRKIRESVSGGGRLSEEASSSESAEVEECATDRSKSNQNRVNRHDEAFRIAEMQPNAEQSSEKSEMPERRKYQAADENEILNSSEIQSIYGAVRLNSVSALRQLLDDNEAKKENLLKYIRENKFPPDGSTLLHLASRRGFVEIITELLLLGCDPAVKDNDGKVPYQLAQNRAVRQAFSRFRSEHPDAFNWKISQIPEIVESSEEYLAAKKQIQREKKKQRLKAKKAAQFLQKKEQDERTKYLTLSDQEKKELCAERLLPQALQIRCKIVENDGNRCFMCGSVLNVTPFEYDDCRFCSLPCLKQHRQQNPARLPP